MQQPLEQAVDQAESIIESAQQRPPKRNYSSDGEKSLHQKLYDIYVEECEKESSIMQGLKSNVNLLEKLVKRESLPCLIVNLYPGKEGYSLMLKEKNGSCSESIHLPYDEAELLEYFDAEELPPILVTLLDKSEIDIFHSGCVIAEIRDYRQASDVAPPGYQSRHILLRPTMQTLACDVQSIASNSKAWSQEDKLLLESQLLLATAEPLCLDPSVAVACTENRLLYNKQKMNTRPMKGNLKRYSASSLNRQQELSGCSPPPELSMVSSCKRSKGCREVPRYDLKISGGSYVDMWKQRPCDLAVPSEIDVEKYAKGKTPVRDSHPVAWSAQEVKDDSGFGCKAGRQSQTAEPIFMQSQSNPPVSEQRSCTEARCERPLSPLQSSMDDHSPSIKSKPDPGSMVGSSKELVQMDIICPDTVSTSSSSSTSLCLLSQEEETFQSESLLIPSSILEKGSDYSDLSITLPPSSDSSSWNTFTPEQTRSFFSFLSPDPASQPPTPSQTPSVEVNSVQVTPTAALSTSSQTGPALASDDSSQPTPDPSTVKPSQRPQVTRGAADPAGPSSIHVVSPPRAAPSSVSDSDPVPGSLSVATAPAGLKAGHKPSRGQPPPAQPSALPVSTKTGVQFFLKSASGLKPVRLLQLPQGSLVLKTQLEPQEKQQQQLVQLIPAQQLLQHPAVSQQPTSQSSTLPCCTSGQQAVVIKLAGVGSLQSQSAALSQLSFIQRKTGPQQHPAPFCLTTVSTATKAVTTTSAAVATARRATVASTAAATARGGKFMISTGAATTSSTTATARGATVKISTGVATASYTTAMARGAKVMIYTSAATASSTAAAARGAKVTISTGAATASTTTATASTTTATARGAMVMISTGAATASTTTATASTTTATARGARVMISAGAATASTTTATASTTTATARGARVMISAGAATASTTTAMASTTTAAARGAMVMISTGAATASTTTAVASTATSRGAMVMISTGATTASTTTATASTTTATARGAMVMIYTGAATASSTTATASTTTATARGAMVKISAGAAMASITTATASTTTATARGAMVKISTGAAMASITTATASTTTATARGAMVKISTGTAIASTTTATVSTTTAMARGAMVKVSRGAAMTSTTTAMARGEMVKISTGAAMASTTTATASTTMAMARGAMVKVSTGAAMASTTTATASTTMAMARGAMVKISTGAATTSTTTALARGAVVKVSTGTAMASTTTAMASTTTAMARGAVVKVSASAAMVITTTATASTTTAMARGAMVKVSTGAAMASTTTAKASTTTAMARGAAVKISTGAATASTTTAVAKGAMVKISTGTAMASTATATASTTIAMARGTKVIFSTGTATASAVTATGTTSRRVAPVVSTGGAMVLTAAARAAMATAVARRAAPTAGRTITTAPGAAASAAENVPVPSGSGGSSSLQSRSSGPAASQATSSCYSSVLPNPKTKERFETPLGKHIRNSI